MNRERRQSPFSELSPAARRAAAQLALLGLLKAVSLIVMATALAQGITRVIAGDDRWRDSLLLALAAAVARAAIAWAIEARSARLVVGEKERLRAQLARRVLARGGRDLEQRQGELAALATRGLDDLDPWFTQYLPALLAAVTIPLVVLARILAADLVSAAVIILTLPLVPVFMILIGSYTADRVSQAADSLARLSNHLVELARGLPVLIGLGRAEAQAESLSEISEGYRRRTMTTLRVAFLSALALELIATISVALVAVFIGVRLVHGTLSLEIGLLVLILAPECYQPFREIGAAHHAAEDGREALGRIHAIIDRPLSRLVPAMSRPEQAIEVRDLTVRYPDRAAPAIDRLSFSVPAGTIAALTGPSGSGKTTVLAAISGLLGDTRATSGFEVSGAIAGVDRDQLAWVSQHPVPMTETVLDDVALAAHRDPTVEVMPILTRLGIDGLAHRHPAELSPGELRRVAVARVLARVASGATLLLLDEPTAHLDRASSVIIIDAIASLRGKVTILLATHDLATRQLADLEIAVGAGRQIEQPLIEADILEASTPVTTAPTETSSRSPAPLSLRDTWRLLHRLLGIPPSRIAATLALGSLAALSGVALTALSGWLIVRASEQPPILTLAVAIVGVRFFGVGRAVFRYAERLVMHDALLGAASRLRLRVWQGLIARGPTVQRRLRGDDVLDSLIGDVDRLRDLLPRVLFPPLVGVITMLVSTMVLAIALPAMLPVMIVTGITSLVVAPALALWADRQATRSEQRLRSQIGRRFSALVDAAAEFRLFSIDRLVLDELDRVDRAASAEAQRAAWSRGLAGAAVVFSCLAASAWSLRVSAGAVAAGQLSGEMVAVLALTPLALIDPLLGVPAAIQQLPALRDLASRFAWLDAERPVTGESFALGPIAAIELGDVSARWSPIAPRVFEGISANLERSEWLTVTGPSGSGKSTLLALVMGFLRPDQGSYLINGRDTAGLAGESIRQSIAWCPQDAHLFDSTLRANLLLARPRDAAPSEAEMELVLEQVGLGPLLADMPLGLDTRIGPQGAHLSGGQRQRVAVARALLTGADLLLIDEPTAHLDQESARRLMDDLRRSLSDRAVIVVTHRPDDLEPSDKRLALGAIPQPVRVYG